MKKGIKAVFIHICNFNALLRPGLTFACILLLSLLSFPALSQETEIRARVIDSSNFEPVAFSTVYIDEYSGTITDELGFFRLQVSRARIDDTLKVSCIGYLSNRVPLRSLDPGSIDSIFLLPNVVELESVEIQARSKRAPRSKDIIRHAISQIPENYPDSSVLYNGYYREYIKKEDEYINLFESIINLEDPGFGSVDNFNAGLMYKRINMNFRVDTPLMRPYDNRDKFVPHSRMPIPLNNELVILRAHDPVRNYNRNSLYFIDRLETDFIRHHNFSSPQLTYLDDRPYFSISFEDNQKYTQGVDRISAKGTIYIDALNYGIKRINYRGSIEKGTDKQKLFELSLEYELADSVYFLHYLSFNNLFNTRNFALLSTRLNEDMLELTFNKPVYHTYAGNPDNYLVFFQEEEQEIRQITIRQNKVLLSFSRDSKISENLKINMLPRSIETRKEIAENERNIQKDLRIEFQEFRDMQGNEIADREFETYYQYREFFTNLTREDHEGITRNLIVKSKPVIENQIFGEYSGDTSWLNTPLIAEDVAKRTFYSRNEKLNSFLGSQYSISENRLNDIVYIHTDREVYAPEDTIWFKAYVRNKKFLTESYLSKTFNVLLVNEKGKIIKQEKYLIEDSEVHGQLLLNHTLDEGIYHIAGYSSWITNFDAATMFRKKIMVAKEKQEGFRLIAAFDKANYYPGDTIRLLVNCYDDFNREVDDVSFSYRFVTGRQVLQRGEGNTSFSWLDPIPLVIPSEMDTIPVIELLSRYNKQRVDTVYSLPVNSYIHMDFFPEGGMSINGAETRVAFKAVTKHGDPVEIEGNIIDQEGKVLSTARAMHDGMGAFSYNPQEGGKYFFQLTRPAGLDTQFPLPEGRNRGWLLHLKNYDHQENEIELEISNVNTGNDTALITLMIRDYLCYYEIVRTGRKRSVTIPLEDLPPGIAVITLFDNRLLPQAERLVYLRPEQNCLAEMKTDRNRYIPRDSVTLSVSLSSDIPSLSGGTYSLSVIDNQLCTSDMLDEPDIISSLFLSPEIHGKIHRPNDYFDQANEDALADIDLLLMTQGWRNYIYPGETENAVVFKPVSRDLISGSLTKQSFSAESKATGGELKILFGGITTSIPVEKDGEFSFLPEYSPEFNTGIFLQAEDMLGQTDLSIVLHSTDFEDGLEAYLTYLTDSLGREPINPVFNRERFQDRFSLGLENHQWLEEVVIRKTVKEKELKISDLAFTKRTATQDELDAAYDMQSLQYLVRRFNRNRSPVYYSINGVLQVRDSMPEDGRTAPIRVPDYSYAYYILPEDIEEYHVIRGPEVQALYGFGVEFVIDVTLKPFSQRSAARKWNNPVAIEKLAVSKEFYKPLYDTEERRKSQIPDLRKTIHWEPELSLDEEGRTEIKFYNGDRYTRIRCVLEGITEEGIPVHSEYFYEVSLTRQE